MTVICELAADCEVYTCTHRFPHEENRNYIACSKSWCRTVGMKIRCEPVDDEEDIV